MRILFLHPNFPGQLVRPALLASKLGYEAKFLCQTHFGRKLAGVERIALKRKLGEEALSERNLKGEKHTLALAEQYWKGMQSLAKDGWEPDVVVSHSGFGCGLHSSLVWPKAKRIAYVEWWFAAQSALYNFDPNNSWWAGPRDGIGLRARNMPLALELSEADVLVAPTRWQRQQLPPGVRARCQVIPDGVDLERFKPEPKRRANNPLLTYGTRGMEAMRGFPEFVEALPAVLNAHPTLKVEIAGEDQICRGNPPKEEALGNGQKSGSNSGLTRDASNFSGDWLQRIIRAGCRRAGCTCI